jgi:hypothetical protein
LYLRDFVIPPLSNIYTYYFAETMDPNGRDYYAEGEVENIIYEGEVGDYLAPDAGDGYMDMPEEAGGSGDNNSGDNDAGEEEAGASGEEEAGGSGEAGEVYMNRGISAICMCMYKNKY